MRFDTPIYFQTVKAGVYDTSTGNHGEDIIIEEKREAAVTSAGDETLNILYGTIKQDALIVRLQNHYDKPFNRIRIGKKAYQVDKARRLRAKHVFIVSEVP